MLASAATTLLLISSLAAATPVPAPTKRTASVISLPPRSAPEKVFNPAVVKKDLSRVKAKYGVATMNKRIQAAIAREREEKASMKKRDVIPPAGAPYDVHLRRRDGKSGKDPLTDNFDQIDTCEWVPTRVTRPDD